MEAVVTRVQDKIIVTPIDQESTRLPVNFILDVNTMYNSDVINSEGLFDILDGRFDETDS